MRTPSGPIGSASCLVRERNAHRHRMKGTPARLGIRNFKPTLRQGAAERVVATLAHAGGARRLPPNVSAELHSAIWRAWGSSFSQNQGRSRGLRQKTIGSRKPETEPHAMVRLLARVVGIGHIETADMLVNEVASRGQCVDRKSGGALRRPDRLAERGAGAKRAGNKGLAKRQAMPRVRRGHDPTRLAISAVSNTEQRNWRGWYQARTCRSPCRHAQKR